MKKYCKLLYAFPIVAALLAHSSCKADHSIKVDNSTVNQVEIHRYMGKWYEIARYDHYFEKGMSDVSAEYSLLEDGKIRVVNRGIKNGKAKEIIGKGKQPDPKEYPGRLKVSFFLWFYGDYYIMDLDKDYQYALVGSSSDKYLWILCRTPQMTEVQLNGLIKKIVQRGYDPSKLIFK
ncbi:MAG: lipocalin family protein [Bacteroides sp.]|nr:lipocalin family protein [Bacteroides sp.]